MTMPKKPDLDLIHPSLTKPVLWAGVERRIVAVEFMVVVMILTWKGITPGALALVACIIAPIHLIARRAALEDPRMFDLILRSIAWRRHYPAHARFEATPPTPKPSIPSRR
jgi:type IV secretory pathway VirB3-like protein